MSNPLDEFYLQKNLNIQKISENEELENLGLRFIKETGEYRYSYNFSWMGRPIIAYPQDMIAMQELIWEVRPDLIVETGVAHGGSIVYYASLLELIGGDGLVVGIDIDIRKYNRDLIEAHPMMKRIKLIEGSSISKEVVSEVVEIAKDKKKVLICLDSNHTHEHVFEELKLYAPLTSLGSYCIVFDTVVEDMPQDYDWGTRTWGKGNNPKTAVHEYLKDNSDFEIDQSIHGKLLITVAPDGYLKRISI
jgi:cephalosporin hydroxylase